MHETQKKTNQPPSSNTGVLNSQVEVRSCVDWLRVTCDEMTLDKFPKKLLTGLEVTKPFGNYNLVYQCSSGMKICFNTEDMEKYGTHVMLTGSVMEELREVGFTDEKILQIFSPYVRNVTRIDYAIDFSLQIDFNLLKRRYNRNQIKTRLSLDSEHYKKQGSEGSTINFGSRTSEKMIRVYDKAKQLKLLDMAITRVELEAKRKSAKAIFDRMLSNGVKPTGNRVIADMIDFNAEWWDDVQSQLIFGDKLVVPHSEPDYGKWLDMVYGSIEKRYEAREFVEEIRKFARKIDRLL